MIRGNLENFCNDYFKHFLNKYLHDSPPKAASACLLGLIQVF